MAFDKEGYWIEKEKRKKLSEAKFLVSARALMSGFFGSDAPGPQVTAKKKANGKGHTRSKKERRMRRLKHQTVLRNVRG